MVEAAGACAGCGCHSWVSHAAAAAAAAWRRASDAAARRPTDGELKKGASAENARRAKGTRAGHVTTVEI